MVYQVSKSDDNEYSYLAIREVKPNSKRILSGISKNRTRSTGRSRVGSFDLSKRSVLRRRSRSKGVESGERKSKKTTRTKRSKSVDARRSSQSRPLGVTVNASMTKSASTTDRNRSARERTRKEYSVRTMALSMDRPQSRRNRVSSQRPLSRGRSRNPSRQNKATENLSTKKEVMYTTQTEKETSILLSSIQSSESTTLMPTSEDNSSDNQLDSDILIKEKITNAAMSSCNAFDNSMLRVESSLSGWAFSCSDKLHVFMTAIPNKVSSLCKSRFHYSCFHLFLVSNLLTQYFCKNYPLSQKGCSR